MKPTDFFLIMSAIYLAPSAPSAIRVTIGALFAVAAAMNMWWVA